VAVGACLLSAAGLSALFDHMLLGLSLLLSLPLGAAALNSVIPSESADSE
jgi:hypothetical protein